ncbi:MAG TPA: hypothetical protein VLF94_03300 [Chlamydiales bacterium]|nr:hypothetical protein [Chlamydiales bacterium]
MHLRRIFLLTFSFFLMLWSFAGYSVNRESKIEQINTEIERLEGIKRGYEAKALKHEDQAQYLQFNDRALLEQKRHIQLAEEYRIKVARTQYQIDLLNAQKEKLLK